MGVAIKITRLLISTLVSDWLRKVTWHGNKGHSFFPGTSLTGKSPIILQLEENLCSSSSNFGLFTEHLILLYFSRLDTIATDCWKPKWRPGWQVILFHSDRRWDLLETTWLRSNRHYVTVGDTKCHGTCTYVPTLRLQALDKIEMAGKHPKKNSLSDFCTCLNSGDRIDFWFVHSIDSNCIYFKNYTLPFCTSTRKPVV